MSSGLGIPINYFCEIATILKQFIYTGRRSKLVSELWVPKKIGKFSLLMFWRWKQVGCTEGNCGASGIIGFCFVKKKEKNDLERHKPFSSYLDGSCQVFCFFFLPHFSVFHLFFGQCSNFIKWLWKYCTRLILYLRIILVTRKLGSQWISSKNLGRDLAGWLS